MGILVKGFASVEPSPGQEVWGYLYKMDSPSLGLLDVMEWAVLNQYRRVEISVLTSDGKNISAQVYVARHPRQASFPLRNTKTPY